MYLVLYCISSKIICNIFVCIFNKRKSYWNLTSTMLILFNHSTRWIPQRIRFLYLIQHDFQLSLSSIFLSFKIRIIQKIWRTKANTCKRTIRQKKRIHSSKIDQITKENISQLEQSEFSSLESITPKMRTVLATRVANIGRRSLQLMNFSTTFPDQALFCIRRITVQR